MDDEFNGEYGTNHAIPNMHLWVQDMRTPWWLACMRNEFSIPYFFVSEGEQ